MISIAQIGCGYWGPNLLRNLVAHKDCRVKIVCDPSAERQAYVQGLYPAIHTTNDLNVVLDDPEIQAVVIATPVATHYDMAIRALKAGKHILVEKPMATTVEEVLDISTHAREKGVTAMVGHTFLYNAAVIHLKALIDSGELGQVRYLYSQRLNLGRIRSDVDALWNLAPHDISIIQYLLGDPIPISITRTGMAFIQPGVEDVTFLSITYPGPVMAHIHVSWLDPHKVRRMTVVGSKKMAVYDDMSENKIAIYDKGIDKKAILGENMDFDNQNFFTFTHRTGDVFLPKVKFVEPLKAEIAHFIDCITNGTPCCTDAEHALSVVRLLSKASC